MAAPNIVNVTTINGKTALTNLTTVTANIITTSSNQVNKINDIIITNYSGSTISANVMINRSSVLYYLGGTVTVPGNSALVLIGKDTVFYLEENDVIQANTSANTSVTLTVSYENIT